MSWRTAQGTVGVRNRSEVEHGRTSSKGIKLMLIIYIYILCIYIYPLYNIQAYHHIWKVRVAGVAAETQRRSCGTGAGCPGRVGTGACGGSELADLQIRGMPRCHMFGSIVVSVDGLPHTLTDSYTYLILCAHLLYPSRLIDLIVSACKIAIYNNFTKAGDSEVTNVLD